MHCHGELEVQTTLINGTSTDPRPYTCLTLGEVQTFEIYSHSPVEWRRIAAAANQCALLLEKEIDETVERAR